MISANDLDTPKYQRPHDLPGATTHSIMNPVSPSTIALLPQELASELFASNDTSTLTMISQMQMSSTISARAVTSSSDTRLVCIGHGFDSAATGMITTVVVPSAVGLILWVSDFVRLHILLMFIRDLTIFLYIDRVCHTEAPLPTNLRPSRVVRSTKVSFNFH